MISSSGIFLPPPEAAAPIPRGISACQAWILSSTPPILDDLWVENPGLDVLVLAAQQGKKKNQPKTLQSKILFQVEKKH